MKTLDLRTNQNPADYLTPQAIRAAWLEYRGDLAYGQWLAGYRADVAASCKAFAR